MMETVTMSDIVSSLAILTAIITPAVAIYKVYKKVILDRFENLENRVLNGEAKIKELNVDNEMNKKENILIIKSLQACLKGLKEQGCNGPVTEAIQNIDEYLLKASHLGGKL